ncbi:MAG: 4Fe-4S cluster-binding domain-containing protein [Lachnospiraceae bacterium]|nr:4Fe-4S cluster-binding domain-containing protein [Lachnospiraceae bacterium]
MHYKYAHPELFKDVPKTDFKSYSGNIVIYGAGFQGLLAAHLLKKQGVDVICFADQNKEKQGKTYFNLPIISPEEMGLNYSKTLIIVTPYSIKPVYEEFKNKGYNVVTPYSLFLEFDSDEFDLLDDLPGWYRKDSLDCNVDMFLLNCNNLLTNHQLFSSDLSVSQVCNLKCRECTSIMTCYQKPKHFALEEVIQSLKIMMKDRYFDHIYVEGGETFLWKPLPELLQFMVEQERIYTIIVITNGTIIPDEEVLNALSHPKIFVKISDYGSISKKDKLMEIFNERGIRYKLLLQKWYKMTAFSKAPHTPEKLKAVVENCCKLSNGVTSPYVADGKLFCCPIQGNLHNTGIYPSEPEDYVDLTLPYDEEQKKKIEAFYQGKKIVEFCRHCDGRGYTNIEVPPAEQLQPGEEVKVIFK